MLKRMSFAIVTMIVTEPLNTLPAVAQSTAAPADPTVSVAREVLERYAGRYQLNDTIVTVTVTEDGRMNIQLAGQPAGPPMRTVSASEFANDAAGVRVFFEDEGPNTTRIRSVYNGSEVVGTRIADAPDLASATAPFSDLLDGAARQAVVTQLAMALRDRYVFPDVGEQAAEQIDAALAAGEYDSLGDPAAFAARLSSDVRAIAHDKHLVISSMSALPSAPASAGTALPRSESGIVRADMLAGGIGYLEVVAFPRRAGFKPPIDRAMSSLADCSALIIDLRRNIGGLPEGVAYLVSFLLPGDETVHINDVITRIAGTNDFDRESFTSQPTPVSFADRPVYVLTSSQTFSGGEEFAYDVKSLGLGVLVGELTAGGGNLTGPAPLGNDLIAMIPLARAENAFTKGNWEGHGVEPNVAAPAADALGVVLQMLGQDAVSDIAAASQRNVFTPRTAPLPGSEAALRSIVAGVTNEPPDLTAMNPRQADMLRPQLPALQAQLRPLGEIRSVSFIGPGLPTGDAFEVAFANGTRVMTVMLDPEGLLVGWQTGPSSPGG
ncbi:hypothetical protein GCM10009127_06600 [Alteraurantiacibacter aestuarii]|uniref:Tail specific protease domain-containing protein n=1 Tax=Alteraurantiacibacter aestuarii TaxID=650004 RepID=A0A844ZQQ5_9SPHN|nr:S41 family peptidase [Alteraurantiacibacter aestuarii]MXO89137.1 hypothetical protein [Alteraurantiacibacter aestuarii]